MIYDLDSLEFDKVLTKIVPYAQTNYAKEEILKLRPSNVYENVLRLLEETETARKMLVSYGNIPLGGVYDLKESLNKAKIGGMLLANELLNISNFIYATKNVLNYYRQILNLKLDTLALDEYFNHIKVLDKLKKEIDYCISEKATILDQASLQLATIRRNINQAEIKRKQKLQEIVTKKASFLTENLIVSRKDRLCVCVKAEYKNSFKGIILDESASHTTVYIEPEEVVGLTNQLFSLENMEKEEIENILRILSASVCANITELLVNLENITTLDIIFSKATYANFTNAIKPSLNQDLIIDLKQARHPLIDQDKIVPIDIKIGENYNTIIITGPNTGGKTVALKTTGLLTLMAQTGILTPATNANLNVFDNVFVDIGDEQSIEQSLSTFSSHMKNVIQITEEVTANSLVLLDELGSGTDPKEGACLAIAIIEYLKGIGAITIATTHYADLKAYAFGKTDIINASVEFNLDTLEPTYKLLLGVPGSSNAIKIAKRLGLSNYICDTAYKYVVEDQSDLNVFLENLEKENNRVSRLQEENAKLKEKLEEELQKIREERQMLNDMQDEILRKASINASKLLSDAKTKSEELLHEIEQLKKKEYKEHEIASVKYKARNLNLDGVSSEDIMKYDFKVGDTVYVKKYAKEGTILTIDTAKDRYEVKMGPLKFSFKKNDLEFRKVKTIKIDKPKKKYEPSLKKHAKMELDLRGFRYEEVHDALDKFIDNAFLAGLRQVSIIHGFGTGAVRQAVYAYLKKCPYVKSTRFGGEGEGLNGCTIVELK